MASSLLLTLFLWGLKFGLVVALAKLSTRSKKSTSESKEKCIQIVVLGDIGRSPRMQYHAISFADAGLDVYLVGYALSKLHPDILSRANIKVVPLRPFPQFLTTKNRGLFLVCGPLKVLFQLWTLFEALYLQSRKANWMLVQNPPAIPTLAVCIILSRVQQTRLVIDWHNLGFSILALKLGTGHLLVKTYRFYEYFLSRFAYAHICVTNAMARYLAQQFHIEERVVTLCDRPAQIFQPLNPSERDDFMRELAQLLSYDLSRTSRIPGNVKTIRPASSSGNDLSSTLSQKAIDGARAGSTKVMVSPTSWTSDENFGLLLEALVAYDRASHSKNGKFLPDLLVVITGKGPDREGFETEVEELYNQGKLSTIEIMTAFFEDLKDYARLLASADLGISLHTSSSGIDLPMKVLDMFGAALPVAGWSDFEAWSELVTEGRNGLGFDSAAGLQKILQEVFVKDSKILRDLRKGAAEEGKLRWDHEWRPICGKLFAIS